jgi:hypothetical protein
MGKGGPGAVNLAQRNGRQDEIGGAGPPLAALLGSYAFTT